MHPMQTKLTVNQQFRAAFIAVGQSFVEAYQVRAIMVTIGDRGDRDDPIFRVYWQRARKAA